MMNPMASFSNQVYISFFFNQAYISDNETTYIPPLNNTEHIRIHDETTSIRPRKTQHSAS